jgi:hypothetical protein
MSARPRVATKLLCVLTASLCAGCASLAAAKQGHSTIFQSDGGKQLVISGASLTLDGRRLSAPRLFGHCGSVPLRSARLPRLLSPPLPGILLVSQRGLDEMELRLPAFHGWPVSEQKRFWIPVRLGSEARPRVSSLRSGEELRGAAGELCPRGTDRLLSQIRPTPPGVPVNAGPRQSQMDDPQAAGKASWLNDSTLAYIGPRSARLETWVSG